jgi:FemAB-related protein (PEP-CTERM system-associated)
MNDLRHHHHGGIILQRVRKRDREIVAQVEHYIAHHPSACFAHRPAYRDALHSTYRTPELCLAALDGRRVVGAAPFSLLWSPLAGPYLVLGPFASYADLLADSEHIAYALLAFAVQLGERRRLRHVHVRSLHAAPALHGLRGATDSHRFIAPRIDLRDGADAVWTRLQAKTRNVLRRAQTQVAIDAVARPEAFAHVFTSGARSLGSPFHGSAFFEALQRNFGERARLWLARSGGEPAAAALAIIDGDVMHYVYGQNVHALRGSNATSLLIWHMIEDACALGLSALDLGRSEQGSSHDAFKQQWGPATLAIHDTHALIRARHVPDLNPTNPAFQIAQRAWSRLPLPLARRLGPLFVRGLG